MLAPRRVPASSSAHRASTPVLSRRHRRARPPAARAGGAGAARAPKAPLGNVVVNSPTPIPITTSTAVPSDDQPTASDVRWAVHREAGWHASPLKKVMFCRRYGADRDAEVLPLVIAPHDEGGVVAGVGGLRVCGCWHSCLICGAKIAVYRARVLEHIFRVWDAMGNSVIFLTFSARHRLGQALEWLVTGLRSGWAGVTSPRPWRRDRDVLGVRWYVRAFEVTEGDEHGWHPHYHLFLLVEGKISQERAEALCAPIWERWRAGLAKEGMTAVAKVKRAGEIESAGFDVKVMDTSEGAGALGRYPFSMALEAVGGVFKRGRAVDGKGRERGKRHRTPFEIMEHYAVAVAEGDAQDAAENLALIEEWSLTATKMRFRQCPITKKMREYFTEKARELRIPGQLLVDAEAGIEDEDQLDQLAAEAEAEGTVTAAHMPRGAWLGQVAYELDTLRLAGRRGGFTAVVAWFDQRRIPLELTEHGEALLASEADEGPSGGSPPVAERCA